MKAVMYGAGNIGRGFIGLLFSQSGYEVTFIDVVDAVVESLNREKHYPVRYVSTNGKEDIFVEPVCAVYGAGGEDYCGGGYYGHGSWGAGAEVYCP